MPITDEGISRALQSDESEVKAQLLSQEVESDVLESVATVPEAEGAEGSVPDVPEAEGQKI